MLFSGFVRSPCAGLGKQSHVLLANVLVNLQKVPRGVCLEMNLYHGEALAV